MLNVKDIEKISQNAANKKEVNLALQSEIIQKIDEIIEKVARNGKNSCYISFYDICKNIMISKSDFCDLLPQIKKIYKKEGFACLLYYGDIYIYWGKFAKLRCLFSFIVKFF